MKRRSTGNGGRFVAVVALSAVLAAACSSPVLVSSDEELSQVSTPSPAPASTVPGPIENLMARTSMTPEARELFLAARPRVESQAELASNCRNTSGAHTLGCFLVIRDCAAGGPATCSRRTQIHLLHIDGPEAAELIYASAAHETLHAAYEKIPPAERQQVDRQLEAALPQLDQCRVRANLGAYSDRNPAEKLSELHSVLATEFRNLPGGLEAHFKRYFTDRQLVVAAHDRALGNREQEICDLQARLDQLDARLASMRQQLRQLGRSGSARAYNSAVSAYNALVDEQNRTLVTHNRRVQEYNVVLVNLGGGPGPLQPRDEAGA